MPAYPLYVPLLPEAAQRVLGEPNESALLAYDIHLEEGFEPDRFVDIFDAGPVLTAQVDRTACVKFAAERTVREAPHQRATSRTWCRAAAAKRSAACWPICRRRGRCGRRTWRRRAARRRRARGARCEGWRCRALRAAASPRR
jgi:hypothetical protein